MSEKKIRHQTKNCIRCGKPAKHWGGFVAERGGRPVLAGWCGRRCDYAWRPYHGLYRRQMGKVDAL